MSQLVEHNSSAAHAKAASIGHALERIGDALRFGAVTVIVQDGVVVQGDRTEKLRFTRP